MNRIMLAVATLVGVVVGAMAFGGHRPPNDRVAKAKTKREPQRVQVVFKAKTDDYAKVTHVDGRVHLNAISGVAAAFPKSRASHYSTRRAVRLRVLDQVKEKLLLDNDLIEFDDTDMSIEKDIPFHSEFPLDAGKYFISVTVHDPTGRLQNPDGTLGLLGFSSRGHQLKVK